MVRYDNHTVLFAIQSSFNLFLLFVHGVASTSLSQLNPNQTDIMENLAKILQNSTTNNENWNSNGQDPCLWGGVNCSSGSSPVVTHLDLSGLSLPSSISSANTLFNLLCKLDTLQSLDISQNHFEVIPNSFFRCSGLSVSLKSLNLSSNVLTGPLQNFSNYKVLEILDLANNSLSGSITSQFDGLSRLKSLNLTKNSFVDSIPVYGKNVAVEELVLSFNSFNRLNWTEILNCKNLTWLDLSQNLLSGILPTRIEDLSKLSILLLSGNGFSGKIPSGLSNITRLSRFAANQNRFSGSIPSGISDSLKALDLSFNHLSGVLPLNLLSSPTLQSVDLSSNELSGPIPQNLSRNLFRLRLGQNNFNQRIPQVFGQLQGLTYLELDGNDLDGEIPSELGRCGNLTLLNLGSNKLQGTLPKSLQNLTQLVVFKLDTNNLTGSVPDGIFQFKKLNVLNLGYNSFSGEIPSDVSNLSYLARFNLHGNKFHGEIPNEIGHLRSLIELRIGSNELSGSIPEFFNNQLEVLDLSSNDLSGSVPGSLTRLESLTILDISYNNLSGVLPKFGHYVKVIFDGNKDLINSTDGASIWTRRKKSKVLVIVLPVIAAAITLGFVYYLLHMMVYKRFYWVEDVGPLPEEKPPQIVHGSFITVNSIHRSNIDFSKTLEVVSNPSNAIQSTRFSTYYKAVMPTGASYLIKRLNLSDKFYTVGSNEKFSHELENLGRLSNSNVIVPLAYVMAEDSTFLFYEHVHKGTVFDFLHGDAENVLDWPSRYSIALGVAQGLTFLHGCTQPVLLLDLSTKTIHLKSTKEPQIGDIELYKVIDLSKSTGSLSAVAGSVGYIPPEYAYTMRVTMAGNVYSFGVILLELLTGKKAVNEGIDLAKWSLSFPANERAGILDSRISKASIPVHSQMQTVLKIALTCVSTSPEARPKTRNVLRLLFTAK